jgi:hypothetical protein
MAMKKSSIHGTEFSSKPAAIFTELTRTFIYQGITRWTTNKWPVTVNCHVVWKVNRGSAKAGNAYGQIFCLSHVGQVKGHKVGPMICQRWRWNSLIRLIYGKHMSRHWRRSWSTCPEVKGTAMCNSYLLQLAGTDVDYIFHWSVRDEEC